MCVQKEHDNQQKSNKRSFQCLFLVERVICISFLSANLTFPILSRYFCLVSFHLCVKPGVDHQSVASVLANNRGCTRMENLMNPKFLFALLLQRGTPVLLSILAARESEWTRQAGVGADTQ